MNETLTTYKQKTVELWQSRTSRQKGLLVGSVIFVILMILLLVWFGSRTYYVPLYTNLTAQETGEIKATLDARGIDSEVGQDGSTIRVPESVVDDLKVELAAEGLPRSGSIDYSSFQENMGFGTTDKEFNVLERGLMQTELEKLIRSVDGVQGAQVMITLPEESIWLADEQGTASASIVMSLAPGSSMDQNKVKSLYHLVSKSIPNLPVENIVIMDQMFNHFEYQDQSTIDTTLSVYEQHRSIQRDIERDIQRQLQQMLGTMMGADKVLVTVSTDIDFTKENREEHLVTPVDEENMEGIAVSVERITETYTGDNAEEGGIAGTGEEDIPGFPAVAGSGSGDYELIEERINNDVNRITREIVESPYQVMDIGIQVMVEPPDPEDMASLPQERMDDIQQVLTQVVRTSISNDVLAGWDDTDINERVFVSAQPFNGKQTFADDTAQSSNLGYVLAGGLGFVVLVLLFLLLRKPKRETEEEEREIQQETAVFDIPDVNTERDSEEKARRRQLEKMAREKPEEFSKLVRTWLSED
ncbi:flagellar M-ring protein FliF [Bacillus sp. H-16]|uniref:flagellar basal-body MS-ring/collar protein FliF n=1 Tax=Alteribacter salitolerans TaxID=2912333 RepID=UPI001964AEB0|nr:flagellar basal-body MS-ring/collar protein FliF [Alteribacter salitolerans]MBM7094170.1 flagellar M-ring protein FliF [Alteribacter salitolerans]